MGLRNHEVEFYEKENGRCPILDFFGDLSKEDLVLIELNLERLKRYGKELKRPYVAPLRDHIWELRVRSHHGQYRLLYFFFEGDRIVLTNGFRKKTDKVPDVEIERALECMRDYLSRQTDRR
jgi:phage-related protein